MEKMEKMEKQNWSLIFLALCLVLAFSVSPVEARCGQGEFCDRDGDGLIKQHTKGQRCEGEPDCDDTNVCDGTEGEVDHRYAVRFDGSLTGGNESGGLSDSGFDWGESTANGGSVAKFGPPPAIGELDISYFRTQFTNGNECFPESVVELDNSGFLYSRKGLAQADLNKFTACADEDDNCSIELGYGLEMEGMFQPDTLWPPSGTVGDSHVLTLTGWSIFGLINKTRNISCSGEGTFPPLLPVKITVTRTR